jgi:MFS superfamily sulfate permease-like transporter
MGGAAIVIGLQQLKGLLGLSHFTSNTDIVSVTRAVWISVHEPVSILPFFSLSMDTERYHEKKSSNETNQ